MAARDFSSLFTPVVARFPPPDSRGWVHAVSISAGQGWCIRITRWFLKIDETAGSTQTRCIQMPHLVFMVLPRAGKGSRIHGEGEKDGERGKERARRDRSSARDEKNGRVEERVLTANSPRLEYIATGMAAAAAVSLPFPGNRSLQSGRGRCG